MNTFTSFDEFVQNLSSSHAAKHVQNHPMSAFESADEFERMRLHLLKLYKNVKPVHSFVAEDGQYIDCIPIDQQPALRNLSTGGKPLPVASPPVLRSPPTATASNVVPTTGKNLVTPHLPTANSVTTTRDNFGNDRRCPAGAIPMRRVTLEEITRFRTLNDFLKKAPRMNSRSVVAPMDATAVPHRWAHAYQYVNNCGGSSTLNIWDPTPTTDNFSLSQVWFTGGDGNGLQTLEAGWQVFPSKYSTNSPVLFIYWTADGYNQTGNYNMDAPAFVQVSSAWVPGVSILDISVQDGVQKELVVQWQRDDSNGNWWLFLQGTEGMIALGYYPASLYGTGQLSKCATEIDFGGEVTGVASGQMGSGAAAGQGINRAAYQRQIFYFPAPTGDSTIAALTIDATAPNCYSIDLNANSGAWTNGFFFGGPGCS